MNFDLEKATMFLAVHGSHAYGLNTPESDYDIRGVACPPQKVFFSPFTNFEQSEGSHTFVNNLVEKHFGINVDTDDSNIFSLIKFVKLAADCNPNIIELLFLPSRCKLFTTKAWEHLEEYRDEFISLKAKYTFSGYAFSQLKRIRNHKKWIDNPPVKPSRVDLKLPRNKIGGSEFLNSVLHIYKDKQINLSDEFVERVKKEKEYLDAMKNWTSYETWLKQRNKKRASLEAQFSYDTKHASHLVRLLRVGLEILETGKVNVDRTNIDADELRAIKNEGLWSYDKLMEWSETTEKKMDRLYIENPLGLPKHANINLIEKICLEAMEIFYKSQ